MQRNASYFLDPVFLTEALHVASGISHLTWMWTTILGEINIANGRSPETWGRGGVLKYPDGAALHAIQTLPMS